MKAIVICLSALLLSLSACAQARPAEGPTAAAAMPAGASILLTYVGNEGVLISDGTKSVLIDGLHREYEKDYLSPPPEVLAAMEAGRAPYDTVRLVLVSHVHLDHFHAESVGLHLKNNPRSSLVSSSQTMIDIARNYRDHEAIRNQTHEITPAWKERITYEKDGIKVTLLGMKHGTPRFWWIKNLGHIIEIGGKKLFHFGDADVAIDNFSAFNLPAEKIDIAFVPYWFLLSDNGRRIVREHIAARSVVAVHISPVNADAAAENAKKLFTGAEAFTRMGQTLSY